MTIGIANDHHGIVLKNDIVNYLKEKNINVINYGCDTKDNIDYVDYAVKLCSAINEKKCDLGILICGTGIGMSIVANKINGIICGKVTDSNEAKLTKEHNMSNVIALSEYTKDYKGIVDAFINSQNSTEERHIRRINKIRRIENER